MYRAGIFDNIPQILSITSSAENKVVNILLRFAGFLLLQSTAAVLLSGVELGRLTIQERIVDAARDTRLTLYSTRISNCDLIVFSIKNTTNQEKKRVKKKEGPRKHGTNAYLKQSNLSGRSESRTEEPDTILCVCTAFPTTKKMQPRNPLHLFFILFCFFFLKSSEVSSHLHMLTSFLSSPHLTLPLTTDGTLGQGRTNSFQHQTLTC